MGDHEVAARGQLAPCSKYQKSPGHRPFGAPSSERSSLITGWAGVQVASHLHWSRLAGSEVLRQLSWLPWSAARLLQRGVVTGRLAVAAPTPAEKKGEISEEQKSTQPLTGATQAKLWVHSSVYNTPYIRLTLSLTHNFDLAVTPCHE